MGCNNINTEIIIIIIIIITKKKISSQIIFLSLQTLFIAYAAPADSPTHPTAEVVIDDDGKDDDSSIIVCVQQGWAGLCKYNCSSQRTEDHEAFLSYHTGFVNLCMLVGC